MNIILLDVKDGLGLIPVVVEDVVDEDRLRKFVREGLAALVEKDERDELELAS
jgi:hypothetical protein